MPEIDNEICELLENANDIPEEWSNGKIHNKKQKMTITRTILFLSIQSAPAYSYILCLLVALLKENMRFCT